VRRKPVQQKIEARHRIRPHIPFQSDDTDHCL
jgi:hypothetical protein